MKVTKMCRGKKEGGRALGHRAFITCIRLLTLTLALSNQLPFISYIHRLVSSLWPVYGFFAPLILLVLFMGGIFALHFIPWPF